MKIILSRKSFDSEAGGYPNLIIENLLIPFPIPSEYSNLNYIDVNLLGYNLGHLFKKSNIIPKLKNKTVQTCHLDPDIENGLFGQCGTAARHLINKKVGIGDIFLFFGWFKEFNKQTFTYNKLYDSDKNCIYAYFKVGKILDLNDELDRKDAYKKYQYHPHVAFNSPEYSKTNILYVANNELIKGSNIPGMGRLKFSNETTLTMPNQNKRTLWKLPNIFLNAQMSYHLNSKRWSKYNKNYCQLQSVYRGQEFVIEDNNDIEKWAINLIKRNRIN